MLYIYETHFMLYILRNTLYAFIWSTLHALYMKHTIHFKHKNNVEGTWQCFMPYIYETHVLQCWVGAWQWWARGQIGGGWLVGMPMTKMPKSRDSHNAMGAAHNNSRNVKPHQAGFEASWEKNLIVGAFWRISQVFNLTYFVSILDAVQNGTLHWQISINIDHFRKGRSQAGPKDPMQAKRAANQKSDF